MKRPLFTSLQTALTARFLLVAILPLVVFGGIASEFQAKQLKNEFSLDLQSHSEGLTREVGEFLEELQAELRIASDAIVLLKGNSAHVDAFLKSLVHSTEYFEAIYLLDAKGRVKNLSLTPALNASPADYQEADFSRLVLLNESHHGLPSAAHPSFRWSDIFVSPLTGNPAITLSLQTPGGMLLGTIPLKQIHRLFAKRIRQSEAMQFALLDHHGTLIADSDGKLAMERVNLMMDHPEIFEAIASGQGVPFKMHEGGKLLESVSTVSATGWVVYASLSSEYISQMISLVKWSLGGSLATVLLMGGGLSLWMSRRVIRPLLDLQKGAQLLAEGRNAAFAPRQSSYAEIEDLSQRLQEMAAAVIERETFLEFSEERYRSVITNLGEGLLTVDAQGAVIDCNPAAERILHRSRARMLRQPVSAFGEFFREDGSRILPEDYPVAISLQRAETVETRLIRFVRHDGLEVWLQVNSRPLKIEEGKVLEAIASFADVTSLKLVEESLRHGKERFEELYQQFQALLEGISDRISLITPEMEIAWTNQDNGVGCIAERAIYQGWCCYQQLFGRIEPCADCPVVRCFASGLPAGSEISDDQDRLWSLRAFPVHSANYESGIREVVLMAEEITDKRSLEQRQMRANQLAALGELAAGVAHEINNPISGVINYAQLIVNHTPEESREHDLGRRIIKEGDRIAKIVRELLIFARSETQEVQTLSVREALGEALTLCEAALRKEQIHLQIDLPPGLPLVESRSHQLQQLLLNLLVNARHALAEKYSGADDDKILKIGGEPISVAGRPFVRIRVRDHGIGIPAESLHKVMNPFYTTKPAGVGTGLGLSISFEIAKRHGGSLQLFSEHGQWTEAVVELPAAGQG